MTGKAGALSSRKFKKQQANFVNSEKSMEIPAPLPL
jgi:hypothetical protein